MKLEDRLRTARAITVDILRAPFLYCGVGACGREANLGPGDLFKTGFSFHLVLPPHLPLARLLGTSDMSTKPLQEQERDVRDLLKRAERTPVKTATIVCVLSLSLRRSAFDFTLYTAPGHTSTSH